MIKYLKIRKKNWLLLLPIVITIILGFQNQEHDTGTILDLCINCCNSVEQSDTPLDLFSKRRDVSACTEENLNSGRFRDFKKLDKTRNNKYKIFEYRTKSYSSTLPLWYTEEHRELKNDWVDWLAILMPELDFIALEKYEDINGVSVTVMIFGAKMKDNYAFWAWKIRSGNRPPQELKFLDLLAGDKNEEQLYEKLKNKDFETTKFSEVIKAWIQNNIEYKIEAVLTPRCINDTLSFDMIYENRQTIIDVFDWDDTLNQPDCITQNENCEFNLLTTDNRSESVKIWLQTTSSGVRQKEIAVSVENEYVAWVLIAYADDAEIYSIENEQATVFVHGDSISIYDSDGQNGFIPVELLSKNSQYSLAAELRTVEGYERSSIKPLVQKWLEDGTKSTIVSYFERKSVNIADTLKSQLFLDYDSSKDYIYLIERFDSITNEKRFYKYDNNGREELSTWYNTDFHETKNPFFGKLALAENVSNVKRVDEATQNDIVSFVVSDIGTNHPFHLWSWKFNEANTSDVEEYNPFKYVYDKSTAKNLSSEYAKSVKNNNSLFTGVLSNHIVNHFNNSEEEIILQIYPKSVGTTPNYSPLELLRSKNATSTLNIPPPLKNALINGSDLQLLIKNSTDFYAAGDINQDVWFDEKLADYEDPWLAWLCLADANVEAVALGDSSEPVRVCFISNQDKNILWSWVAETRNSVSAPVENKLIDGEQSFELSGVKMKDYVNGLYNSPNLTTAKEKQFFLDKADKTDLIKLTDFFSFSSNQRVLLWRENKAEARKLYRTGIRDNYNSDFIDVNLVGGDENNFWQECSLRYRQEWYREKFKKYLGKTTAPNLQAWFGENKLGISRDEQVGVFLSPANRDFGFVKFENLREEVDDLVYIPMKIGRDYPKPDRAVLFDSWVRNEWDKEVWRANPLGYFDKIN